MIDFTRIFSDMPGTPGRRQQMPRMISSTATPAPLASYNLSMMIGSTRLFIFAQTAPGLPLRALAISTSICSSSVLRRSRGLSASLLDHRRHRFARLRRGDQRVDDGRLLAGAVQRLLDRDDVRVCRRLLQEGEHHIKGFVRVVDDDVLRPDRRETIAAEFADALGKARHERQEFEVRPVLVDYHVEVADAEQVAAFGDDRIRPAQFVAQHVGQRIGHARFQLQPDHAAATAALDRIGEVADEILGLFIDLDIAVAQHAERRSTDQRVSGKQHIGEALEQRLDRHIARNLARQAYEARRAGGDHHQLAHRLAVRIANDVEHHRQPLVRDERKRVRRIERLGRQDREDLFAEMLFQPHRGLGVHLVAAQHMDARLVERGAQVAPHRLLARHQRIGLRGDRGELLCWRQTIGRAAIDVFQLLPLEASHAHHEEFVEVGARDRQEAQPLQQGMRSVARLFQHPPVERQPRQLAVEIAIVDLGDERIVVGVGQMGEMGWASHDQDIGSNGCGCVTIPAAVKTVRASGIDNRLRLSSTS
ncbi:hypothetical protein WR25_22199 [Diploscapter pachys]|uniref:Uncharacterized protein n=1 Tax=Diploscapter pachys TaxID=2018661 RepID=A0A2A2K0Z0_9BILA|nr:hypothetical protein WR25_22199 [Diploscapter pachys]